MSRILGVIGGMGPEATAFFYEELIAHTKAGRDQEHIDTVILGHATMPDRTRAILSGQEEPVLAAMEKDVRILEAAGAANIAIPCNTAHYFYEGVQAMTKIPVIHMVRETVLEAKRLYADVVPGDEPMKIGIMATDGTVRAGVYARECEKAGAAFLVPSGHAQVGVMSLIYKEIKAGKKIDARKFETAYRDLKRQGASCVILACTELSVYRKYQPVPGDCIDALEILVKRAVERSGGQYKH